MGKQRVTGLDTRKGPRLGRDQCNERIGWRAMEVMTLAGKLGSLCMRTQ